MFTEKRLMNSLKSYLKPVLVLMVICLVTSGILAVTNKETAPVIEAAANAKVEQVRKEVLPDADNFDEMELSDLPTTVTGVYKASNGVGYVFMLTKPGMSIDLGGIAKGFAADEILRIFKEYGIESAMINLGSSSIYALGAKPNGDPWSVAIRHPRQDGEYLCVVQLTDQALSTSGDYERYFIQNGKRYHHIFDPATGYPAEAGIMSSTVVIDGKTNDCCMLSGTLWVGTPTRKSICTVPPFGA